MCAGILKILDITWSPIAFKTQCVQSTEAEYTHTHNLWKWNFIWNSANNEEMPNAFHSFILVKYRLVWDGEKKWYFICISCVGQG